MNWDSEENVRRRNMESIKRGKKPYKGYGGALINGAVMAAIRRQEINMIKYMDEMNEDPLEGREQMHKYLEWLSNNNREKMRKYLEKQNVNYRKK